MKTVFSIIFILSLNSAMAAEFLPKSFEAVFIQKYKVGLSKKKKIKESRGDLSYLYPGHLKFAVSYPDKEILVSNPKTTWIYSPPFLEGEKGNVVIKKTGILAPVKLFDYMKAGLRSNKKYVVKKVSKTVVDIIFRAKIVKKTGLKSTRLFFNKNIKFIDLKKIKLVLSNGKEREIELSSIKLTGSLTKKDFTFKVPANTLIQK